MPNTRDSAAGVALPAMTLTPGGHETLYDSLSYARDCLDAGYSEFDVAQARLYIKRGLRIIGVPR